REPPPAPATVAPARHPSPSPRADAAHPPRNPPVDRPPRPSPTSRINPVGQKRITPAPAFKTESDLPKVGITMHRHRFMLRNPLADGLVSGFGMDLAGNIDAFRF